MTLQFLIGLLVFLGIIGTFLSFMDDNKKTWRSSSVFMTLVFIVLFVVSFYSEVLLIGLMITGTGLLFVYLFFVRLKSILNCSIQIEVLVEDIVANKNESTSNVIIQYRYQGEDYQNNFTVKNKQSMKYDKNKTYPIYLNPENPYSIVKSRMVEFVDLVLLLIGITMVGVGAFAINCFIQM